MDGASFWLEVLDAGGTLALAIFAIVMLRQSYRERVESLEMDRDRLATVIDRNTESWIENTKALTELSGSVGMVAEASGRTLEAVQNIRVNLAQRPCIGGQVTSRVAAEGGQ